MGDARATVLHSLAADPGRPRHGVELARAAQVSSGALYPLLIRLRRAGLLEAHWSDGRRGYRLTAAGAAAQTTPSHDPTTPPHTTAPRLPDARSRSAIVARSRSAGARPRSAVVARWLPAALAAVITAWAVLARPADVRLSDLAVYTGAVDGLRHGDSLYDFISAGNAPFTYPPFAGLLFLPLAHPPPLSLQLTWTLATLATVAVLALLVSGERGHARRAPAYALILVLSAPVSSDLKYGQVSLFLAALVAVDVLVSGRGSRAHGALIGLAAAVKLTPLIFIPLLWLAGRRTAALVATSTFAACGALAAIALPADSWRFWTAEMSHVSRLGYITSVGNQSLNGALMRFEVGMPARSVIALAIGGAVAALALRRAGRLGRDGDWLSALVVAGAAGVVLSPVSWTHHQVWLVLAALLAVRGPDWFRLAWPALVLGLMLLPVTALGPPLWSNSRLVLAIVVAALLPLSASAPALDRHATASQNRRIGTALARCASRRSEPPDRPGIGSLRE